MPDDTLMGAFGDVFVQWEHVHKYYLEEDLQERTVFIFDDMEYPWQDLVGMEDTPFSEVVGEASKLILKIATPSLLKLSVLDAMEVVMTDLIVTPTITVAEFKEKLAALYTGNINDCFIQIKGKNTAYLSYKLSVFADPSKVLIDYVSTRVAAIPNLLRPPLPSTLADTRLKLAAGVTAKAAAGPPAAVNDDRSSDFAEKTKAKLIVYVTRAAEQDRKKPEDMLRLMNSNGSTIITGFRPPEGGKKNGGKVRSSTGRTHLCSVLCSVS